MDKNQDYQPLRGQNRGGQNFRGGGGGAQNPGPNRTIYKTKSSPVF